MKKEAKTPTNKVKTPAMAGVAWKSGGESGTTDFEELIEKVVSIIRDRYKDALAAEWTHDNEKLYAIVLSEQFEDLTPLDRVRTVTSLLREQLNGELAHIGQLLLLTPEEFTSVGS